MTLANAKTIMWWPNLANGLTYSVSPVNFTTLDAAGEYSSVIFKAREAMTLSHAAIRWGTVSGSPICDIRIELVDPATGLPTGTLWNSPTNTTNVLTSSVGTPVTASTVIYALTAPASIAVGDWVCVKVLYAAGATGSVGAFSKGDGIISSGSGLINDVYMVDNVGTPTLTQMLRNVGLGLGNSATSFYQIPLLHPFTGAGLATVAYNNATAGDWRGMRFRLPFKAGLSGIAYFTNAAVAADRNLLLYDSVGTTLIASQAIDGDMSVLGTGVSIDRFNTVQALAANTWYRLVLEGTEAANIRFVIATSHADTLSAWPGDMNNYHYTTHTNAGGWIDSAPNPTTLMIADLVLTQFDDGAVVSSGVPLSRVFLGM